jgi:hypothetical protein
MGSRLFIDLVLHIKMRIPCRGDPSLPLKVSQKQDKTLTKFQQYMYLMHLDIMHCDLVEHPIVDIWEDLDTLKFLQHGEYPPQVTSSHQDRIQ